MLFTLCLADVSAGLPEITVRSIFGRIAGNNRQVNFRLYAAQSPYNRCKHGFVTRVGKSVISGNDNFIHYPNISFATSANKALTN